MPPDLTPDDNTERIALENAGRVLIIRLREEFPRFAATCIEGESDGPCIDSVLLPISSIKNCLARDRSKRSDALSFYSTSCFSKAMSRHAISLE